MSTPAKSEKDRVVIFDTTLRDGEQCPGATMTHDEKLEVAELLDDMGVDIIEAGFPIASEGDFAAVHEIATRSKNAVICGLSRAAFKDIDRCAEAIKPAKQKRIHTFLSTSPVHMKYKLQKEPHEVYEMVIAQVTRARSHTDDVEWSAEDGTRTEFDFLCRCVEARHQGRRHDDQHPGHGRLHRAGGILQAHHASCARPCRTPTRRASRCTATTISAWRWRTRWPASTAARGRSNAPSTASASGPATPRSKRS